MSDDIETIIDTLRGLLEPGAGLKDDTLAEPPNFDPNTLYIWPIREAWPPDGVDVDRHEFTLRVAWGADRAGEVEGDFRSRAVSLVMMAKVKAYRAIVRINRARPDETWSHIAVASVDYDRLRGQDARGFFMDITGYGYSPN